VTSASGVAARAVRWVTPAGLVALLGLVAAGETAPKTPKGPKPPPPRYTFAGVPWGAPADSARALIRERGYQPVPDASDSQQIVLRGKLFEHQALVTGHLDEQRRLVRWVVLITPRGEPFPYPEMRAVYDEVGRETESRYGPPRTVTEKYRFPYERGDGREDNALRDGQATIRRVWVSGSGDRLTVEMDANVSVVLNYECPEWGALEKRRQAKRASDL
jgi:hypothetical protein